MSNFPREDDGPRWWHVAAGVVFGLTVLILSRVLVSAAARLSDWTR